MKTSYEDLPLLPFVVAETVCQEVYTGSEVSVQSRSLDAALQTEALRQKMTLDMVEEFANLCDKLCKAAYESPTKDNWFKQIVKKNHVGLRQLYVFSRHWLAAYLNNPEQFKSHILDCTVRHRI